VPASRPRGFVSFARKRAITAVLTSLSPVNRRPRYTVWLAWETTFSPLILPCFLRLDIMASFGLQTPGPNIQVDRRGSLSDTDLSPRPASQIDRNRIPQTKVAGQVCGTYRAAYGAGMMCPMAPDVHRTARRIHHPGPLCSLRESAISLSHGSGSDSAERTSSRSVAACCNPPRNHSGEST
jgi:hypothetical protein